MPQIPSALDTLINLAGSFSTNSYEMVYETQAVTFDIFGGKMTATATAEGERTQTTSSVTTTITTVYEGDGIFTDDGRLQAQTTIVYTSGKFPPSIDSVGNWSGTSLLYEGDKAKTDYYFRKPSVGTAHFGATGAYNYSGLGAKGSNLDVNVDSEGNEQQGLTTGHGNAVFSTPLVGRSALTVTTDALYQNQAFRLLTDANATLRGVATPGDQLGVRLQITAGTAVSNPSAAFTLNYAGGGVFQAGDKLRFDAGAEARRGVPAALRVSGEYQLQALTGSVSFQSNGLGLSTTPSASVWYTSDLFGEFGLGTQPGKPVMFFLRLRF